MVVQDDTQFTLMLAQVALEFMCFITTYLPGPSMLKWSSLTQVNMWNLGYRIMQNHPMRWDLILRGICFTWGIEINMSSEMWFMHHHVHDQSGRCLTEAVAGVCV